MTSKATFFTLALLIIFPVYAETFTDDFNDGNLSPWTVFHGDPGLWQACDGHACVDNAFGTSAELHAGSVAWQSTSIEARAFFPDDAQLGLGTIRKYVFVDQITSGCGALGSPCTRIQLIYGPGQQINCLHPPWTFPRETTLRIEIENGNLLATMGTDICSIQLDPEETLDGPVRLMRSDASSNIETAWFDDVQVTRSLIEQLTYVALGDSFASGEGAGEYKDTDEDGRPFEDTDQPGINMCHRSAYGSSEIAPGNNENANILPPNTLRSIRACSGSRIAHLKYPRFFQLNSVDQPAEPPQFNDIFLPSADIVTLSIGGNDAGFERILTECAWTPFPGTPFGRTCDDPEFVPDDESTSLRDQVSQHLAFLASPDGLRNTYLDLKEIAQGAMIFAIGYPRLFDVDDLWLTAFFQESEQIWLNELADELNNVISCAALEAGIYFVDITDQFRDHAVCTDEPWIHQIFSVGHRNERFHPNRAGQVAYANALRLAFANPQSGSCAQSRSTSISSPTFPSEDGVLHVEGSFDECGVIFDKLVPGENVRVVGMGFEPHSAISIRMKAEGAFTDLLGTVTANEDGTIDATLRIDPTAPASGNAFLKATGLSADGMPRTLYREISLSSPAISDVDEDGISDLCDNCIFSSNEDQDDTDSDGIGDVCDICPNDYENDWDLDGLCADVDPCSLDPFNDLDGDGYCANVDGCPSFPNTNSAVDCLFADGFEMGNFSAWSSVRP